MENNWKKAFKIPLKEHWGVSVGVGVGVGWEWGLGGWEEWEALLWDYSIPLTHTRAHTN